MMGIKVKLEKVITDKFIEIYPMFIVHGYEPFYNGTYKIFNDGKIIAYKSEINSLISKEFKDEKSALDWCLNGLKYEIVK